MGVRILGHDLPDFDFEDITLNHAAGFCEEYLPYVWRHVNVKFIEAPGTHCGFKALAVCLTTAIGETLMRGRELAASNNICAAAGILARCNYPVYYVSASLLESLKRSSPPKGMTWAELKLPFPGIVFMLPRGALHEPDGQEIQFIGIVGIEPNETISVPGTPIKVSGDGWDCKRLSVFWTVGNGFVTQDCTFPESQPLEPSPEWIAQATDKFRVEDPGAPAEFSSYVAGILANLLLVKNARPELVEAGGPTGKRLKSGLPVHRPNFIGRKYETLRRERTEAGGKFTELDWRCGHFRKQHFGPGGKDEKIIWIDPYIAFTRGLAPRDDR